MEIATIEKAIRPKYYFNQICSKKKMVGLAPHPYFNFLRHVDVFNNIQLNKG